MGLVPGQRLVQYEALAPLGAGGMGEVWRARDTRLGREVALKVLPDGLAQSEEWLRRFDREACTLASLNHPNLATVYGIDQVESVSFIAMELVHGEDLAARLARGPLPLTEALDVCRQIAEGLEVAHEAGVIHRDLKPANVMVTPEGRAKLLDFGLAKPARPATSGSTPWDGVASTEPGRLLGTPLYMAPEQARGRPIDRRVDVWAFGCVLYECLTGRRAFDGDQLGDVLVAVLNQEPDWTRLPATTPPEVRALLARCLDKEPRTRLRDAGEARVVLERPLAPTSPAASARPRPWLLAGAFAIALTGAGAYLLGRSSERAPAAAPPSLSLRPLTQLAGMEEMPALSPDGEKVAFVSRVDGKRQVFLHTKGAPQPITQGPAEHSFPRWVDESTLVWFRHPGADGAAGALEEKIVLSATPPRSVLVPAEGEAGVSHDGRRLATFRMDDVGPTLVIVERRGPRRETVHRLPYAVYSVPRWSPDDRSIAFQVRKYLSRSEIHVMDDVEIGETRLLVAPQQTRGLAWLPDGSGLVYASSEGSTLAYPPVFRLRILTFADGRDVPLPLLDAGYVSYVEPDLAAGRLIASRVRLESDIYRFPVDGSPRENVERAERITWQTGIVQVPSVSHDGEEVAYLSDGGGRGNIWVARVDGSRPPRKITDESDSMAMIGLPVWSPSADRIVYWKSSAEGFAELRLTDSHGSNDELLVRATGGAHWSGDGRWVYYIAPEGVVGREQPTYRILVDGGEPELVREGAVGMKVSPDGRTCYFQRTTDLAGEVWKASPLDGPAELLVTISQDRIPQWPHEYTLSPDERWLVSPLRDEGTTNLWLISTEDGTLRQVTDFQRRATTIGRQVAWSPDGRFLFAALMETDADVVRLDGALPRAGEAEAKLVDATRRRTDGR